MSIIKQDPPFQYEEPQARQMLAPAAYSESLMPSLSLARSSRKARLIGKLLLISLCITFVFVLFAPWQQAVTGTGSVLAYSPRERQQVIQTPIKGRIVRFGENIVENAHVKEGDLIAEVQDIDTSYLSRLESQLEAAQNQVEAAKSLREASLRNLEATKTVIASYQSQLEAYRSVKDQVVASAETAIEAARNKVLAEEQQLIEFQAALAQVQADYDRQKQLFEENIVSQLKFQEAERKLKETQAKVSKAKAYVESAESELEGKRRDRDAQEQRAQVQIDYAMAMLIKTRSDVAKAESDVAKANSDLNKAEKDLLSQETLVSRQRSQQITAPFDGFLTQITPNQGSQVLKEGDPICVIVPDTKDRAVQILLYGNDAPLVTAGRHVRLQFEGWPAVQFAGWPSVAVGTFGGEVVSVDASDNGMGQFRILVLPDEDSPPWPEERYLRQGVRANGWVLLDTVPLWYEIWRRMNGFPPVVTPDPTKTDKGKKPSLPKP